MLGDLDVLESEIGYKFRDRDLLIRTLTHKSRIYEKNTPGISQDDNEQLEFLGDSILGFVISEYLVRRYPTNPEGKLSKLKAHLVSAAWLFECAQRLRLGDYLLLGRGEEMSGGREKRALLADALEAVIAGIYLDGGSKTFTVEVRVGKDWVSRAEGNSKKSAGQKAAQLVLQQLTDWGR
jgi:ribonuclease-3